jgi:Cyclic nucleotide-binding domain
VRIEGKVTSVSWAPSEAITAPIIRAPFDLGITHYDDPPPDRIDELEPLRQSDRFRFANELLGWAEFDGRRLVAAGYSGGGRMANSAVRLGPQRIVFHAVAFPDLQVPPEASEGGVRLVQTTGGRAGLPAPRIVPGRQFFRYTPPTVWTTLALTLRADGSQSHEVLGASPFPRHWIYDERGLLVSKSGLADFREWWRHAFGPETPWGGTDSAAVITLAESALERSMSTIIMRRGAKPKIRRLQRGDVLTEQGQPGQDIYLLLNGVMTVEVDGSSVAEVGPGAVLGERASLEGGRRTATLRATTPCAVAVADRGKLHPEQLSELSVHHQREHRGDDSSPVEPPS